MKTILISTASALALAGAAFATPFEEVDQDGSGTISLEELQAVAPEATADELAVYDWDGDGELDRDEYEAWLADAESDDADDLDEEPVEEPVEAEPF